MDLRLNRLKRAEHGIFSELYGPSLALVSLEHAYPEGAGFAPKIPNGRYLCRRGKHRLHGMTEDFETFEITGVEGHIGLLFHWGNWNCDSDGCCLTGKRINEAWTMVESSREAFAELMAAQDGFDEFWLDISG